MHLRPSLNPYLACILTGYGVSSELPMLGSNLWVVPLSGSIAVVGEPCRETPLMGNLAGTNHAEFMP